MSNSLNEGEALDEDGYPTEETLNKIKTWNWKNPEDLFKFIQIIWMHPTYFRVDLEKQEYRISTAGWSGNESIMSALQQNKMIHAMCWVQSRRGGHYIYKILPNMEIK
jgi:hypothetical protein